MVFTFLTWMLIGAGALLGLSFFNKDEAPPVVIRRRPVTHAIHRKIQPGDVIYMQNGSPYGYEPDGNLR